MTLDAAEVAQVTEVSQRVAAEAIRNLARGTGGANTPIPVTRPGTIGSGGGAGDQIMVRADGDTNAVPAVNATGQITQAGDRVLVSWIPPLGVYATHMLSGSARGTWTPFFYGTGANNTNTSAFGAWTRIGRRVHAQGRAMLHSGGSYGSGLSLGGLPFATATYSGVQGVAAIGHLYAVRWATGTAYSGQWILAEGATGGGAYVSANFGAGTNFLSLISTTVPFNPQADSDYITVDIVYDTDAE